jgi:hypothetical protein
MIDMGEPREAHPSYWAPFVVVGEGAAIHIAEQDSRSMIVAKRFDQKRSCSSALGERQEKSASFKPSGERVLSIDRIQAIAAATSASTFLPSVLDASGIAKRSRLPGTVAVTTRRQSGCSKAP